MQGVEVIIDNRCRFSTQGLAADELDRLKRLFEYPNPEYAKLKAIVGGNRRKRWMLRKCPEQLVTWKAEHVTPGLSVPRGGLAKLLDFFGPLNVELVDRTTKGAPDLAGKLPPHKLTVRDYQAEMRQTLRRAELAESCMLFRSPAGSGKTCTGFAMAADMNVATLVVVPNVKIFEQWLREAEKYLGLKPHELGVIRGSTRQVRPLTVAMQQTLRNCADKFVDTFGLVIADEAQKIGAETFFSTIDQFKARWRVGMSADERRSDRKECLVYDVMGQVAHEVPRARLVEDGNILDAVVRIIPTAFEAPWYAKLEGPKKAQGLVYDRLLNELATDKARNELVMQVLGWCVQDGEPTITLAWRREHCELLNAMALKRGWDSGLMLGGDESSAEFQRAMREMQEGRLKQSVGTYSALGVGFNLPVVSRGIFAGPCAGYNGRYQFGQFCGRFERPHEESGKERAIVYYFWDQHVYGLNQVKNINRWREHVYVLAGEYVQDGSGLLRWVGADVFIKEKEQEREKEKADSEPERWVAEPHSPAKWRREGSGERRAVRRGPVGRRPA